MFGASVIIYFRLPEIFFILHYFKKNLTRDAKHFLEIIQELRHYREIGLTEGEKIYQEEDFGSLALAPE